MVDKETGIQIWLQTLAKLDYSIEPCSIEFLQKIKADLPLSECLFEFYQNKMPRYVELDFRGVPVEFAHPKDLIQAQDGYRWNLITGEALDGWEDHWIVIANQSGDPFILNSTDNCVYWSLHGGEWKWVKLADGIESFIWTLSVIHQVFHEEFHSCVADDESLLLREEVLERIKVLFHNNISDDLIENWLFYLTY